MAESSVDLETAKLMTYLEQNKEAASALAKKLNDFLVAEKADVQLCAVSMAMVLKSGVDSLSDADENLSAVRCIAAGMLAANLQLTPQSQVVLS